MRFSGDEEFACPAEFLWERLVDFQFIARAIPGLAAVDSIAENRMVCRVQPQLSFLSGKLTLTMQIDEKQRNQGAVMTVRGQGVGSSIVVQTRITLAPSSSHSTGLTWEGEVLELGGLLKPVSRGLIEAAGRKVVAESWNRFRAALLEETQGSERDRQASSG